MTYNMTALQEATTVNKLFLFANDATGGVMMGLFMIAIFFVMVMSLKRYSFQDALLTSGFVCFILSTILAYGGFMNIIYPLLFLAVAAFTLFYMLTAQSK